MWNFIFLKLTPGAFIRSRRQFLNYLYCWLAAKAYAEAVPDTPGVECAGDFWAVEEAAG